MRTTRTDNEQEATVSAAEFPTPSALLRAGSCKKNARVAIIVTWDDWGGWYDHEPPRILAGVQGDYQYGFRVPLIVVSAYTPAAYVNNNRLDFGTILRFVEKNFGIVKGSLNFADARATTDLSLFFKLNQAPRPFQPISVTARRKLLPS